MDYCSAFIDGLALFGKFPNDDQIDDLEERGISLFIDLTIEAEDLPLYKCRPENQIIYYPISDGSVPNDMKDFQIFIHSLAERLHRGQKMYIHCRGGHGRSGIVVACLLCTFYGINAEDALRLTNLYHSHRLIMDPRWRRLGSPQYDVQKNFVRRFQPIYPVPRSESITVPVDNALSNRDDNDVIYFGQNSVYDHYMSSYLENTSPVSWTNDLNWSCSA